MLRDRHSSAGLSCGSQSSRSSSSSSLRTPQTPVLSSPLPPPTSIGDGDVVKKVVNELAGKSLPTDSQIVSLILNYSVYLRSMPELEYYVTNRDRRCWSSDAVADELNASNKASLFSLIDMIYDELATSDAAGETTADKAAQADLEEFIKRSQERGKVSDDLLNKLYSSSRKITYHT